MLRFFICLIWCFTLYAYNFNPAAVHLLDQEKNSYLFRGSLPLFNSDKEAKFAYKELIETCERCLGHSLPPNIELNIICLLNPIYESKEIKEGKKFFKHHPSRGLFIHLPIYGSLINPNWLSQEKIYYLVHKHPCPLNHLTHIVYQLHDLLHNNVHANRGRLTYVHCRAGHDRTGLISAAYLMQCKNASFEEVKNINTQISKKTMQAWSYNEMSWYAYYLKYVKKQEIGPIK